MTTTGRIEEFHRNGYTFDVVDRGPIDGEPIVCLHGFPQSNRSWDGVAENLARAGYRILAPNQRGYSPGARPRRRRDYTTGELAGDIVSLLDTAHIARAHIVGHDWGGAVAWQLADSHPTRLASVTSISTPHPGAMRHAMLHSNQVLKSWYMLAFQLPWLPELLVSNAGEQRIIDGLCADGLSAPSAAISAALLSDRDTARSMINWYRALPFANRQPIGSIGVPTLYVWSTGDHYLGRHAAEHTAAWVHGPYRFIEVADASHWLPDTHPDVLAEAIVDHVTRAEAGADRNLGIDAG